MTGKQSFPQYVIHYLGSDFPGILYKITECLYQEDFNIVDVSTALGERNSGEQKNMTLFITCQRLKTPDANNYTPDRVLLEVKIYKRLKDLIRGNLEKQEPKIIHSTSIPFELHVTMAEMEHHKPGDYKLQIDIDIANIPGLLVGVTGLLWPYFNVEDMVIRPGNTSGRQSLSALLTALEEPNSDTEPSSISPHLAELIELIKRERPQVEEVHKALADKCSELAEKIKAYKDKAEKIEAEMKKFEAEMKARTMVQGLIDALQAITVSNEYDPSGQLLVEDIRLSCDLSPYSEPVIVNWSQFSS